MNYLKKNYWKILLLILCLGMILFFTFNNLFKFCAWFNNYLVFIYFLYFHYWIYHFLFFYIVIVIFFIAIISKR